MAYLPMAVYGLEVPPGDMAVSARPDIPAAFRITMAAIDPSAEPEGESVAVPRATLKIIRLPLSDEDFDDEDDEDFDPDEMDAVLAGAGKDDDDDEDEEDDKEEVEVNGGPSDPAKTKKARKAAAKAAVMKLLEAEGMDVDEEDIDGVNGAPKSAKALGKMPVTDMDEDDEDDEDDDDDEDGAEIEEFVICTLDPTKQYQQTLDIAIGEDERVWFKVTGTHSIYLTGNYIEPAANPYGDDEEEDSDDELDYDLEPDSDELEDDEELDALDELADPIGRVTEIDEDEDEEVLELVKPKKGKNKRAVEDVDVSENLDDLIAKDIAADNKLSKKQAKKQKKNDGSAAAVNGEKKDNSTTKADKKVAFAKEIEQGPTPSKSPANGTATAAGAKNPQASTPANGTSTSLSIKTVQGVVIDTRKVGTGPAAKKGDRVSMRYIGKLQNGNVFDANKKGKPFSFKLGAGEVIKGWDIGVAGHHAGSEYRLTIPPHQAYGSNSMPGIPANSTLIFDIKMLEINKGN